MDPELEEMDEDRERPLGSPVINRPHFGKRKADLADSPAGILSRGAQKSLRLFAQRPEGDVVGPALDFAEHRLLV